MEFETAQRRRKLYLGKIFSNASLGVSNDSDVVVNLNGTTPDGADGTINVDTDYIYSQTGPGASGGIPNQCAGLFISIQAMNISIQME